MNWCKTFFYTLPLVLALLTVTLVSFKTDLSAFMIAGDNAEEILLASEMQSGKLSRRYLLSISSVEKQPLTADFKQTVLNQFKVIEGVNDVWSPDQGQKDKITRSIQDLYSHYGYAFYSLNPVDDLAQLFSVQGLEQRAALLKKLLLSAQATLFKKMALQDPLLLTLDGLKSLRGQMQQVDNNYYNLVLETTMAGLDSPQQSRVQTKIKSVFERLKQSNKFQLDMTGVPVFAVATQTLIQGDITKVSVFSSIALMLLFLLIFRSFSVLFQVFSLLAIVILSSIISTQIIFGYVHGMTVAIGSTLIGICIDYPIHAVTHAQSVSLRQRSAVIAKIWPSMLLGGITTMIGYVALGQSGYPGFQQVAVYAVTGILVSLLLTRFVFPGLLTTEKTQKLNVPLVRRWRGICQQFRPWLLTLLLILLSFSIFGLNSLHWMEDMQELTPELDYLKQQDKMIRARMTNIEPGRFVLVTGESVEAALQKAEQIYPVLDDLKQRGVLSEYFGLYPWLLSSKKQRDNQRLLQQYVSVENQLHWQNALKKQGLSVKHLGSLNYAKTETLSLSELLKTPVSKLIDSRVITSEKQTIVMIWLSDHLPEAIQQAMSKIEGAQYFSQRDMLNHMTKDYTERAKKLLAIGMLLIVGLLIWRFKSIYKAGQTLIPAVLAAFLILAFWSITGEAISFLHLVGFLLVVAICVDYGIFYQENRGGDIDLTYQAMAASMLTSALAFGSLMMAESTSLRILAGVVALGVVVGFILCPLIINSNYKNQ